MGRGPTGKFDQILGVVNHQRVLLHARLKAFRRNEKKLAIEMNHELRRLHNNPLSANFDFLDTLVNAVKFANGINEDWLEMFTDRLIEGAKNALDEQKLAYGIYISCLLSVRMDDVSQAIFSAHQLATSAENIYKEGHKKLTSGFVKNGRQIILDYLETANQLIATKEQSKRLYQIGEGFAWQGTPDRYLRCLGHFMKWIACQRLSEKSFERVREEIGNDAPLKAQMQADSLEKAQRHLKVKKRVEEYLRVKNKVRLSDALGLRVFGNPISKYNTALEMAIGIAQLPRVSVGEAKEMNE